MPGSNPTSRAPPQEGIGIALALLGQHQAAAHAADEAVAVDLVGASEGFDHALPGDPGLLAIGQPAHQHGELVAADAGHLGLADAKHVAQAGGQQAQQLVADDRPEPVVDALETIAVQEHQREAPRGGA